MLRAAVFDAYGTLLDVHSAARKHAARLGADWQQMSQEWRIKHIEYTWVRSLAGPAQHRDFWQLAQESLRVVAEKHGIRDANVLADVLQSYRRMRPYPEVPEMLRALQARGIRRAILSNGEPTMLADGVEAAGIASLLDDVLSAEQAGIFKPHPRVYSLVTDRLGLAPAETAFFSSNPWDAFGAGAFGFRVFWVNRAGQPDEYDLRASATELSDLSSAAEVLG
jgi:2-haloacid dehalogenase